jgi:transposase-like protein
MPGGKFLSFRDNTFSSYRRKLNLRDNFSKWQTQNKIIRATEKENHIQQQSPATQGVY